MSATRTLTMPWRAREKPPGLARVIAGLIRERHSLPPSQPGIRRCYGWPCWLAMVLLGTRWARAIAIVMAWRLTDDVCDGERTMPASIAPRGYIAQFTALTKALAQGGYCATCDPLAENTLMFSLGVGRDPRSLIYSRKFAEMWALWVDLPTSGQSEGLRLATTEQLNRLTDATAGAAAIAMAILGGDIQACTRFADLLIAGFIRLDELADAIADAAGGRIWLTPQQLLEIGVEPDDVQACHSPEDLLRLAGFREGVCAAALSTRNNLRQLLGNARREHRAALPSSAFSRWLFLAYFRHWTRRKYNSVLQSVGA